MTRMTPSGPVSRPWAFLVTFACYGARLHGNDRGSVDRAHNQSGSRYIPADPRWESYERRMMVEPPYALDAGRRQIVLEALRDTCNSAGWLLHAVHARSNHVHAVLESDVGRGQILARLKGRASHDLKTVEPARKRMWARHGSVRELWTARSVNEAVNYVVNGQGQQLTVWQNPDRWNGVRFPLPE